MAFPLAPSFHPPAARGPGRDQLLQARHLAAAAVGVGAVAAEAAERERSASFLAARAPQRRLRHQAAARPVAETQTAHPFHVADVQLRPEAAACRTADAQLLPHCPAAKPVLPHHAPVLAARLVVALAVGHVAAAAAVRLLNLTAVLASLLRPDRALGIARLVPFCLAHVRTARAKDLRALPMAGL